MSPRFASTALVIWSGLLIWAADFLFVYVFAALACARGFAALQIGAIGIVPLAAIAASALAAALTGAVMWWCWRRLRASSMPDSPTTFVYGVAFILGGLSIIAIAWNLLPALLLRAQC